MRRDGEMSPGEFASEFGCSTETVRDWCVKVRMGAPTKLKKDEVRYEVVLKRYWIDQSALTRLLEANTNDPLDPPVTHDTLGL